MRRLLAHLSTRPPEATVRGRDTECSALIYAVCRILMRLDGRLQLFFLTLHRKSKIKTEFMDDYHAENLTF